MRFPVPFLCLTIALLCAAGALWIGRKDDTDRPRDSAAPDADPKEKIVVLNPPAKCKGASIKNAIEALERSLGDSPFIVYDARELGIDNIRAKLQMDRRSADFVAGEALGLGGIDFPIEATAPEKSNILEIEYLPFVAGARGFRISCRTAPNIQNGGAAFTVSIDGGAPFAPKTESTGAGIVDLCLDPLPAGAHIIEISGGDSRPPIRAAVEAGDPPIVYMSDPGRFVGKALTLQGFTVRDLKYYQNKDAALVVCNSDDYHIETIKSAVAADCGCLLIGDAAAARAEADPSLALLLPAKRIPPPPPESRPADPEEDAPAPPVDDAPPENPPNPDTTNPPDPAPAADKPELTKTEYRAPVVALALLIDRSGSMSGDKIKLAKQAALATAEILAADDYICIISFSDTSKVEYRTDIVGSPEKITTILGRIAAPDGGTFFYPAIVDATNQLRPAAASIKHIILITDGATADRFTADYAGLIQKNLRAAGITLSTVFTVGAGGEEDPEFCGLLAKWGGGRTYPASIQQIPALVSVEVRRAAGIPNGASRRAAPGPPPADAPKIQKDQPAEASKKPTINPDINKPKVNEKPKVKNNKPPAPPRVATVEAAPGNRVTDGVDWSGLAPVSSFCEFEAKPGAAVLLHSRERGAALFTFHGTSGGPVAELGIPDGAGGLALWASDPRLALLLARAAAVLSRPAVAPAEDTKNELEVIATDGKLRTKGNDRLQILKLPKSLQFEGELRILESGARRSSLRAVPIENTNDEGPAAAAALRARTARPLGKNIPPPPPSDPPRPRVYLYAASILFVILAAAAHRFARSPL